MKIGITGCSHSTHGFGNPWQYYLKEKYNCELVESYTSGGCNEINIEKVKFIFDENPDLDYFIIQLTEPSRYLIPLGNANEEDRKRYLDSFNQLFRQDFFKGMKFHTAKYRSNNKTLKEKLRIDIDFDLLFDNFIFSSDFNTKYKFLHTLMTFQYLANHYNKKLIFFSWFVDVFEIANSIGYGDIIKNMTILNGHVEKFTKENNVKCIPNDGHYGSTAHEIIFNEYIYPQIKDIIK